MCTYRIFRIRRAEHQGVIIMQDYYARHLNTKCCQYICLIINRYMAASISKLQDSLRYRTVGTSSYRSLSRIVPLLANTVPSYLLQVLVHGPGLRGHRFSRLFDCYLSEHRKDIIYRHKSQTREEIFESANCVRRSDGIIRDAQSRVY